VAKSAATNLTDYIDTIRQEAYNAGYTAAMRAIVEFSGSGTAKSKATTAKATTGKATAAKAATAKATTAKAASGKATAAKATTASQVAPRRQRRAQTKPVARQTHRGDNARYIAEAMMVLPDHKGSAAAIKKVLAGKGHDLPYTSIRHGLGQLQARGEVSVAEDGRTWSYAAQH
jgi:hypothetical protein